MFRCLRGDALHMLGQKKYGEDLYVCSEDFDASVESRLFAADVTII